MAFAVPQMRAYASRQVERDESGRGGQKRTKGVLPGVDIVRWRDVAPWADDDDVEQDLIITLALFDIFGDAFLKSALAFRGGTALHKLHLAPAARYSEDIDLVQREPGPIGPVLSRLRRVLGWIGPARSDTGEHPKLTLTFAMTTAWSQCAHACLSAPDGELPRR